MKKVYWLGKKPIVNMAQTPSGNSGKATAGGWKFEQMDEEAEAHSIGAKVSDPPGYLRSSGGKSYQLKILIEYKAEDAAFMRLIPGAV